MERRGFLGGGQLWRHRRENYSFSAGQYFDVKIEYTDMTPEQFAAKMKGFTENLNNLFEQSRELEVQIKMQMADIKYEI